MIRITDVTVTRAGKHLFKNFNFTINEGEHWVIAGSNGSGKTILLELLAGLVHASKGEVHYIFVKGNDWEERYHERKAKLHYVPAHAIGEFLSDGSDLYYQQRYYGSLEDDEKTLKVKDILAPASEQLKRLSIPPALDISSLMDVDVSRLSNGQLKKLLILRELSRGIPEVLLMDYPFEGLDRESRSELCSFLDFLVEFHKIHLVITDHHHHLPLVINRRLILADFQIASVTDEVPPSDSLPVSESSPPRKETPAVVQMENLSIKYGTKFIIENLSWQVREGERWALTGKNGSGKTTLFSLIYADHPQGYSQQLYLFGRRRGSGESIWDIKRRIAYMGPEIITFLNPKGITATAFAYLRNLNRLRDTSKLESLIHYFKVDYFYQRRVREFSSGQLQMLMVINTFLSDKELLLLDEPFQFLDDAKKKLLRDHIGQHLHENQTLVLISHYEEDVRNWTEHLLRL